MPQPLDSAARVVYLVDGTAYVYRAFHAVRGLTDSRGRPTNAVFGFTRMLLKLFEERRPAFVGMCFDAKGPTFRHEKYPAYKANRPPMPPDLVSQLPLIRQVTASFNLPILELPGWEADDVIASLARQAQDQGFEVVMVTGDKDFIQLVSDRAVIWDPMKEQTLDLAAVKTRFDLEPIQMIDVQGLSGDSTDNVPGVPGIGPKTALNLVRTYGGMRQLYQQIDSLTRKKQKENLIQYRDQAWLSRDLVTLRTDAPTDFEPGRFQVQEPDRERLTELFGQLEFRQLQQELAGPGDLSAKDYRAVLDAQALRDLIEQLASCRRFALDTETTSKNPMQAELVGLSFALRPHQAYYIPCGHRYLGAPAQLGRREVLAALKTVLEDPNIAKVGQNIKYDWIVLQRHGVNLAGVAFDTMLASYLLNPAKRGHGLDQIALDYLGHKTITYADVVGKGRARLDSFALVPLNQAVPYACEDADVTLLAHAELAPRLAADGLEKLMEQVEMPLVPVLMRMEMAGIAVDRRGLGDLSRNFQHQLEDLEGQIYQLAGERFNINSPQQLGRILFEKLALPVQKKTRKKTGYSTDVNVLTLLAGKHELPALVLRQRSLAKLKSTYSDALGQIMDESSGRIHTSFNQTVAATGRLSSSDPNLQNIPVRTEEGRRIRAMFIPRSGWHLLSADYSQIELRILAHCADDPILIQAFLDGEDIHTRTAAEVFQIPPQSVSTELRRQAKAINFGIVYGMSAFGLSRQLDISRKMAATYIDNYFARYRGVKRFMEHVIAEARANGRTSTLLGRIRLLPDIDSRNRTVREAAERTAINTPIQGTAADLIKLAMIRVDAALRERGMEAVMLLSVHDEIVFEVPPAELEALQDLVRRTMEGVWDLKAPLKVNLSHGPNWAEAH